MSEVSEVNTSSPTELLAAGRRHLAVKDWSAAVEILAKACEEMARAHGDLADQCAEPYLWYGKALLGLSREESGVLGDGMPGANNPEEDDDEEQEENGETENGEVKTEENGESNEVETNEEAANENRETEKNEPESTTTDAEPTSSKADDEHEPGPSNGEGNDESTMADNEDDVDNLQLAWEMLDLSRNILSRRVTEGGGDAARAMLAEVHLALGEVALESETYDKAVIDMQSCLEIQKDLYRTDDRRIAETHYQIGLANSLASNFEDAITHFKNAANILESRIKTLENPTTASTDATVKKYTTSDPLYTVEAEIKELKELLPEIQEKIQDMMDYKAETLKRVRETLCPSNGASSSSNGASSSNGVGSSSSSSEKPVSNISHLIKRKRKASETEDSPAKKPAVDS